ncbi:putative 5-formyltetrahydrofolate cyclo-ligase [Roseivivax jejudonensis]|uniref:5-formyltetrahydrofolate cyclo-ligase n=1 Tax=Roseivivax jejudonensis TaxID=1529041 RepID=A0A1X6ZCB6_9RHOB|nr:5-formyltetrahydrofolate cyclo-ligase [Roseivivax jejudonensis]SLN47237.1 putative 5-formyltetrahydrofolate cyclo-ligase [Roseivivax jejudonensis]
MSGDLAEAKAAARRAAAERRARAHDSRPPGAAGRLSELLAGYRGVPVSGYMPIRTEIDPLPAMAEASAHGPVAVPVIRGRGRPLDFARWQPGCALVPGPFGAPVPTQHEPVVPEILIVPLLAFDRRGHRLGYGGGFYDRTLAGLRARGPVLAVGFAFAAQEADEIPVEPTDAPLDLVVTEHEILTPVR